MQGWVEFALQVIEELAEYDKKHATSYSFYLKRKGAKPHEDGIKALSTAMMKADQRNQWEPIVQGVQTND